MAQLNPNFEIDFSDINSYEQIQLMNDTQLAKENLLMHRAYQEPAEDEIIRNHFSSFTFVDFCPKLFTIKQPFRLRCAAQQELEANSSVAGGQLSSSSVKYYELETFSDLFERINKWLKLNKDWRVVSMETLVFDSKTHFNYLKSSINCAYLPQNTRGLRLFLSPSKSRFSGPQKIGCINVVPRKLSGNHMSPNEPVVYETLGDILNRLNELLLTRPIEGRILSVETITLPMSNGYVNTESNYFMDVRLNSLYQSTYNKSGYLSTDTSAAAASGQPAGCPEAGPNGQPSAAPNDPSMKGHCLIDILRVYYEFGPMVGGLVNLIDFIPRFYSPTPTTGSSGPGPGQQVQDSQAGGDSDEPDCRQAKQVPKEAATESLTRLIRRSLAWFESERKRVLAETRSGSERPGQPASSAAAAAAAAAPSRSLVNLKVCNLQVHHKTVLKHQLLNVDPSNVIDNLNTRTMLHEPMRLRPHIVCGLCKISTNLADAQDWCSHLIDQTQIYQLKFVRLAYVVPVYNRYAKSIYPLRSFRVKPPTAATMSSRSSSSKSSCSSTSTSSSSSASSSSSSSSSSSASSSSAAPQPLGHDEGDADGQTSNKQSTGAKSHQEPKQETGQPQEQEQEENEPQVGAESESGGLSEILNTKQQEEWIKQAALSVVRGTNERHRRDEEAHQLGADTDIALNGAPIGQLTYRLFAPCQLVKSSSCFSINPVNSSSPLARRGSLDLNGSGISSEDAHPSTALLAAGHSQTNLVEQTGGGHSSLSGPFFPNLNTGDLLAAATGPLTDGSLFGASRAHHQQQEAGLNSKYFAFNEFELVSAIKRRMEIYVTTNSMKVIAGETLIINLSDSLSCLSTAIEQTVVRAPPVRTRPSTWVCVYILYAAVDEPHLAGQLLAHRQHQQRLHRHLEHIDEERDNEEDYDHRQDKQQQQQQLDEAKESSRADQRAPVEDKDVEPHFDDDFKSDIESRKNSAGEQDIGQTVESSRMESEEADGSEQVQDSLDSLADCQSAANIYNSAYDRTVALPTSPDNSDSTDKPLEPIEVMGSQVTDYLWLDEMDLAEIQHQRHYETFQHLDRRRSKSGKRRKFKANKRKLHDHDSQCSLI